MDRRNHRHKGRYDVIDTRIRIDMEPRKYAYPIDIELVKVGVGVVLFFSYRTAG